MFFGQCGTSPPSRVKQSAVILIPADKSAVARSRQPLPLRLPSSDIQLQATDYGRGELAQVPIAVAFAD